jgi:hypothetical protein
VDTFFAFSFTPAATSRFWRGGKTGLYRPTPVIAYYKSGHWIIA